MSVVPLPSPSPQSCFQPLAASPVPHRGPAPRRILWGSDPYLHTRLLSAVLREACNRRQSISAVYDPLIPHRILSVCSEQLGALTLPVGKLTGNERLIDCSPLLPDGAPSEATIQKKQGLQEEIGKVGEAIALQNRLLEGQSLRLADLPRLQEKVRRIVRKLPADGGGEELLPLFTRQDGKLYALPSPIWEQNKQIVLREAYGISALFFSLLSQALREKKLSHIRLSCALTDETVGILLPTVGLCYRKELPLPSASSSLPLRRYLPSHTVEERRAYRNLALAKEALEAHLDRLLVAYRTLAKEEDAQRASLFCESRLQSFQKRLLIDLFC